MGIAERKEREKEKRRNEIIDAAERVFFQKGFENSTMDEVAENAELSKGTLYVYFNTKEDLFLAIGLRAIKLLAVKFQECIDKTRSSWENILAIGKTYVDFARKNKDYFWTIMHFDNQIFNKCAVQQLRDQTDDENDPMSIFINVISEGMHDGSVRADITAPLMAHTLWTQTSGVLKLASTKDIHDDLNKVTDEEIILAHLEIISNGIKSK